jgi:hypothetical protein
MKKWVVESPVASYSMSDFVEDVKRNCAREDVMLDNDLFNELVG